MPPAFLVDSANNHNNNTEEEHTASLLDEEVPSEEVLPQTAIPANAVASDMAEENTGAHSTFQTMTTTPQSPPTQLCVELHLGGAAKGIRYLGRPDRQTSVFRWIISEMFCHLNRPLDVDHEQFEVLTRTFK